MFSDLKSRDRTVVFFYLGAALVALVGTQTTLVAHFLQGGDLGSLVTDAIDNPATTFMVIDLSVVAIVAVAFMLIEGRRLGMTRLWVYFVVTFTIAISVAFPLFLAVRHATVARATD